MSSLGVIEVTGDEYSSPYHLTEFRLNGQVVIGNLFELKRNYLSARPNGVEVIYRNRNNFEKRLPLEHLLAHNSIPEFFTLGAPQIIFRKEDNSQRKSEVLY